MKYSVEYELKLLPSNVIVEIKCRDKAEADSIFTDRSTNCGLMNARIIKKHEKKGSEDE